MKVELKLYNIHMTQKEIVKLIEKDKWMMNILRTVQTLHLPDWWIGAGFVRSKVWDHLHGFKTRTPLPDIDVIYFDPKDFKKNEIDSESTKKEIMYEVELSKLVPNIKWSVTNQARMHVFHPGDEPYKNSSQALSKWVETATCIGVTLSESDSLMLTAPHGVSDLVNLKLRPVESTAHNLRLFHDRIGKKNWLKVWPNLQVVTE